MDDKDNRLTILLIDDDPGFTTYKRETSLIRGCASEEVAIIENNFKLIWLKDICEIKAYLDGLRTLKNINCRRLMSLGVIPEIIVFDYCLTRSTNSQSNRLKDPTNPNISLYSAINTETPYKKDLEEIMSKGSPENIRRTTTDRYGLISGTFLCSFFHDYITTGLPTTAYSDIAQSNDESGLVEWFNKDQMRFASAERKSTVWGQLICQILIDLRDRVFDLLISGLIAFDIYQLIVIIDKLESNEITYSLLSELVIELEHTNYGSKKILLSALFYDHFFESKTLCVNNRRNVIFVRDPDLITQSIKRLVSGSLRSSVSTDTYARMHKHCEDYISAWESDSPKTQSFLTNNNYSKAEKRRLMIMAMALLVQNLETIESPKHLRNLLFEVFFNGSTRDNFRQILSKAGITIEKILEGEVTKEEQVLIYLVIKNNQNLPDWWRLNNTIKES